MLIRDTSSAWSWISFSLLRLLLIFGTVILVACGDLYDNDTELVSGAATTPLSLDNSPAKPPSNLAADQQAIKLLNYLYELTGKQILSGQEQLFWDNEFAPYFPSIRERYVYDRVGQYPAVYSTDFGDFHETDPVLRAQTLARRGEVVDAVIEHAQLGSVIQLHYHMVEPTEPDGTGLRRYIDGVYNPEYIDQILNKGSPLNQEYENRLDEVAGYLARLREAGVAVLWRPFHEMNGPWFWWSRQPRFKELWEHQWRYFTEEHGLTNLLWVYSVNHWEPDSGPEWDPTTYYPGHEFVDVLGVDTYIQYGHNFNQYIYDALLRLGGQRPIAFTENGQMPELALLRNTQPRWVYWTTWFGDESSSSDDLYRDNYVTLEPYVVTQNETFQPVPDNLASLLPPVQDFSAPPVSTDIDGNDVVELTGTPGDRQVQLNWNALPDVPWYNVWLGTSRDSLVWLEGTSDTSYSVSQLGNGSTYYFAVTTYIDGANGPFSNIVEITPVAPEETTTEEPATDTSLVIELQATPGIGEVRLDWNALPDVYWYNVWFGTQRDSLEFLEGTGSNSFTARQLSAGVPYYFAVTPYINEADGPFSNIVEIVLQ